MSSPKRGWFSLQSSNRPAIRQSSVAASESRLTAAWLLLHVFTSVSQMPLLSGLATRGEAGRQVELGW